MGPHLSVIHRGLHYSYPLQSVRTYERYHGQRLKINSSQFVVEFVMASVASFFLHKKIDCILLHFFVTDVLTACRNMSKYSKKN